MRIIANAFAVFLLVFALTWAATGNDFLLYRFFAPKQAAVQRQVFEQTKSYNQGMIQELQNMQFQYEQADDAHKAALASIILHRAADYNPDLLPPDLRAFINSLKEHRQ